jgi:hypothetical protein
MTATKKSRREMLEEFVTKKPDDAFSRYGLAMECMNMYAQMLSREARNEEARRVLTTGIAAANSKGDQHARSEMETLLGEIS